MTDQDKAKNDTKNEKVDFLVELIKKTNEYSQRTKREETITKTVQPEEPVEGPCIFKLPHELIYKIGETYHEPQIVSIGPYHNNRHDKLKAMDDHKILYLSSFCKNNMSKILWQAIEGASYIPWTIRIHYQLIHAFQHSSDDAAEYNSLDLKVYIDGIKEIEAKARKCYSEGVGSISTDEFVGMMIRDGCFILELFLRFNSWKPFESEDPIQRKLWASSALYKDLLLLENQIPFFVLTKLFTTSLTENLRKGSEEILINLSLQFFNKVMRRPHEAVKWHPHENGKNLPLHLLDLIRSSFTTPLQKLPMDNIPSFLRRLCAGNGRVNPGNRCTSIPCVSKLFRAGIEVKPSYAESFLVVKFKKGVIHMPNITIDDVMSSFLVNCVGFEQCQPDMPKYFMRYTAFLDFLLNTKEDVDLLYERKVIEHSFETDEKLATYINALGKDLLFGFDNSSVSQQDDFDNLSKMFNEINTHYRSGIRWKWADFKREYCNKPWLLISALVALVYLLLTFGQTFTAIYAYVHPKK